jgi:hypothetical protein
MLSGMGGGGLMAFGGMPGFSTPPMSGVNGLSAAQTVPGLGGEGSTLSPESQQGPQSQQQEIQQLIQMIQMLMEEIQQQQGGQGAQGGGAPGSGTDPGAFTNGGGSGDDGGGGGGGGSSPIGGGGGGSSPVGGGGGGSSEGGSGGPVGATPSTATGSPSQAVDIANQYLGKGSGSFTFANYTHAGGTGNDCADFVSACVADAGTFKKTGGDANVGTFQTDLQSQGWTATSSPQPGDVAIVNGSQHAELVSGPNGQCIGSNGGETNQTVSHDTPSSWGSVKYWQPPKKA